jgi:hypothetical protein
MRKLLFFFVSPGFCKAGLAQRDDELGDLPCANPLLPFFDQVRSLLLDSYAHAMPDVLALRLLISTLVQPPQKFEIPKFLLYIQQNQDRCNSVPINYDKPKKLGIDSRRVCELLGI